MRDNSAGLTTVDYLILGLVDWLEPCTSYDMKREVESAISHFWTFSHTALYQAPPQLVAAGLLTDEQETAGRRRRLYLLTDSGRARLREWLDETQAHAVELRDLALLKLFLRAPSDGPVQIRDHASAQVAYRARRLAEFRSMVSRYAEEPSRPERLEALRFGIMVEETALAFWGTLAHEGIGTSHNDAADTHISEGT
jgi:DNA-binding PadR family transcriptional regulator